MIRVALIEDNRLLREGMSSLLNRTPDVRVVLEAATLDAVALRETPSDVLLLDVGLAEDDSLSAAGQLHVELPEVKIIIMDLLPLHDDMADFVKAGIAGIVHKDATVGELLATIRRVNGGERVIPAPSSGSLLAEVSRAPLAREAEVLADATRMSIREQRVIDLIGQGKTYEEVAEALTVTLRTVRSDVRNVMERLDLRTRLE